MGMLDALKKAMLEWRRGSYPTPPSTPPTTPPSTDPRPSGQANVVTLPWGDIGVASRAVVRIPLSGSVAFKFTIPPGYSSNGKTIRFNVSPTGGNDYYARGLVLSDKPGDFVGLATDAHGTKIVQRGHDQSSESVFMQFSVGGYPAGKYGSVNMGNPDLAPGTYYFNVRQQDPTRACSIDYAFKLP